MIKERPILFSAQMVRAILEGRKTVTRRVVKVQPRSKADIGSYGLGQPFIRNLDVTKPNPECPYGRPGDRLWVRESWAADAQLDAVPPRELSRGEPILYPADGVTRTSGCSMISAGRVRPSIHMPRWASRILLEITDVRVERLQDMSEYQALAEGVLTCEKDIDPEGIGYSPVELFGGLWTMINGDGLYQSNPWVWVIEFKRVTP